MDQTRSVAIVVFDGVEVLDFAGPYEVCSLAARDGRLLCRVRTHAATPTITCMGGLRVQRDAPLSDALDADAIIVPGGPGARKGNANQPVIDLIQRAMERTLIASVCTGSFLLARAGVLGRGPATTHPLRFDEFRAEFPHIELVEQKIVDRGEIISAGGISSGIDLALYIVERWFGSPVRRDVATRLDGPWK
jgi:transcriptional regulator GlxA family with amidase domain